jgi:tetratricopeptide (TPR) repeat protein
MENLGVLLTSAAGKLVLICALGFAAPSLAATEAVSWEQALELYRQGADDSGANERANEVFAQLTKAAPGDPLPLAYLGSTWVIKGRDAWAPWNKLRYVDKGLALLDKAVLLLGPEHDRLVVEGLPASVRVKSVAGIAYAGLPDMFKRFDQGRDMLRALLASPLLGQVEGPRTAYIHYFAGNAARRDKDPAEARKQYHAAVAVAPEGDYAERARRALAEMQKETQ